MPQVRDDVMHGLYGRDVFEGFTPTYSGEVQGWNGEHPSFLRLLDVPGDAIAADVGVWKGLSTINMALALKNADVDGCVIAIDTFLGSPEHWDVPAGAPYFQREHGRPDLYSTFLSNVVHAGVQDYIVPMPQTSVTAAYILRRKGIRLALAHVDAAHEYEEVLRDAQEYWSLVRAGGYLIGDDYHESWPGVIAGAGRFCALVDRPMAVEYPKWIIQKQNFAGL